MDLDALLNVGVPDEAPDFRIFWERTREEASVVPLRIEYRELSGTARNRVYEIEFDALGGVRCGGWITWPRNERPVRGVVCGHGYGGREMHNDELPGPPAVAIYPCARGFNRSRRPDLPDNSTAHVVHGLQSCQTYILRGCVAELWSATSALLELAPEMGGKIDYHGDSFGGGLGALMLPWEPRIRRAALGVPTFGNHPLRVTLQCNGSGEPLRRYVKQYPEAMDVLKYFDAAVAARRIAVPTLFMCALFDPAVPPPGQFAVHNAMPGDKKLHVRQAGHFEWPGLADEDRITVAEIARWVDTA